MSNKARLDLIRKWFEYVNREGIADDYAKGPTLDVGFLLGVITEQDQQIASLTKKLTANDGHGLDYLRGYNEAKDAVRELVTKLRTGTEALWTYTYAYTALNEYHYGMPGYDGEVHAKLDLACKQAHAKLLELAAQKEVEDDAYSWYLDYAR